MFRADVGLRRIYPWILLGPYVALVAAFFPLERGRLRLSLPLNLGVCAAFIAASHAINARTHISSANVVVVNSQRESPSLNGHNGTTQIRIQRLETNAESGTRVGVIAEGFGDANRPDSAAMSNAFAQLPKELRPTLAPPHLSKMNVLSTLLDLLAYGAIIGGVHWAHFYRRFREREHQTLALESNLAQARLSALRAQLHPHFLFNSLNAVVALLRRDPRQAEATLMSLSELLRLALSQSERPEVALREELLFVDRYLEIQETRYGDKLHVEREIDPAALNAFVPALLLQPLVENAIRHGIEPAEKAGLVRLTAQKRNGQLLLTVEDDGVGLQFENAKTTGLSPLVETPVSEKTANTGTAPESTSKARTGIGLTNLRNRLETLYGASQSLELSSRPGGGVIVQIAIPFREMPAVGTVNGA